MKNFTAAQVGQLCSNNEAVARQIADQFLWDFEQWRNGLKAHIDRPQVLDCLPNLEKRRIAQVENLHLNDYINDESIHSVDGAAIIALTLQTHIIGHLPNWLDASIVDEQQFSEEVVFRWCKRNNLTLLVDSFTPAQDRTEPAPVATARKTDRKPSIENVALDYMREEYGKAHFQSANYFHKHLIKSAGVGSSPFEMGTGENARRLFCTKASSFYDPSTLSKHWPKIRGK